MRNFHHGDQVQYYSIAVSSGARSLVSGYMFLTKIYCNLQTPLKIVIYRPVCKIHANDVIHIKSHIWFSIVNVYHWLTLYTLYLKIMSYIVIYRLVCKIHAGHVIILQMVLIKVFCHHVLLIKFISHHVICWDLRRNTKSTVLQVKVSFFWIIQTFISRESLNV